jgi:hypothetical protein
MAERDDPVVKTVGDFWDALVQGESPVKRPPPELAQAITWAIAQDDAPRPDSQFVTHLEEHLMATANTPAAVPSVLSTDAWNPWNGRERLDSRPWARPFRAGTRWHWIPTSVATAALVTLTLIGSFFAFGPGRSSQQAEPPVVIPAVSEAPATPAAGSSEGSTIEQITFGSVDELPSAPAAIDFIRIELPPGASISYPADDPGLKVYVVESGIVTALLDIDVHVTRDGKPHGVLFGGEERQLEPGEGFMWGPNNPGELRNDGTEPVQLAVVAIVPSGAPIEPASDPGL